MLGGGVELKEFLKQYQWEEGKFKQSERSFERDFPEFLRKDGGSLGQVRVPGPG